MRCSRHTLLLPRICCTCDFTCSVGVMETFGLRRTQSLKSLSWVQERSRDMPAPTRWDRKSVLQLVHHYQSCGDLRSQEKMGHNFQTSERFSEEGWRGVKNRDNVALGGALRAASLSRSHSMDFLPERENSGTRALCALFESKAKLQHQSSCSPKLNSSVFARDGKSGRNCSLQDQRSHNRSAQRVTQSESRRTTDGLPESYNKVSRYSYDDKQSTFTSLTKKGIPKTQASSTTSACSSVRDKSARYQSIDSVGAELIAPSVTRVKSSKLFSAVKEMCSACLTPVYPMEKIVANKLILHNKCFCCKHCQKKLSIHNYSSLYGDFYCMSHYLQLFKRKRNDEGFGSTPNKDHRLQKDKGTDEVDTTTVPKTTKSNSNSSNISRDSSAEVATTKSRETEMRNVSQGKLKVNWPPQKKQPRHDLDVPSFKLKDKLVMSTRAKMSEIKGKAPKTDQTSEEAILEEPKFRSGATKTTYFQDSPAELQRPFHLPQKDAKKKQTAAVAVDKINVNKGTNKLDTTSNKTGKSVRFAPNVDFSDYDQTCQLATGGDAKDHDVIGLHVKTCNNANDTLDDSEQSRKLREIQHEEKPTTIDADVKSPALLQNEDKKDERRHLDDSGHDGSSSDKMDIELEKANPLTKPERPETLSQSNRRKDDKTELTKEHNTNQQVLAKTNSPMSYEKQPDRSKVRLGSWYKGRSPLSKLFAASGTEKPSKTEAKTAVGLPGSVFQSSSDKNKDATKLAACDNEPKMDTDEKNRDEADTVRVEPEEDAENRRLAPDFNMLDSGKVETVNTELEIPTSETSVGLTDLVQTETRDTNPADDTSNEAPFQPETDGCEELPSIATCGPQESTHELTVDQSGILSVGSEPVFTECNQDVDELDNATKAKDRNIDQNTFLDVHREASQASPDPPDHLISQESLGNNPVDALFSVTNDASSEGLSLLDAQPEPSQTEKLGLEELATPPDADRQPLSTLTPNNTEESILDIFSSNSVLFAQQPVATPDDIFAEGERTSEVLNELLTPSVAPPPQGDLFFLDMFASEMLPRSQESSDVTSPLGGVMEKKNPQQSVANAMTHSNWMDDLLG